MMAKARLPDGKMLLTVNSVSDGVLTFFELEIYGRWEFGKNGSRPSFGPDGITKTDLGISFGFAAAGAAGGAANDVAIPAATRIATMNF
jgi:hypothetical protein